MSDRVQHSLIGTSLLVLALALGARLVAQPEATEESPSPNPLVAAPEAPSPVEPSTTPEALASANSPAPEPALTPEPARTPVPASFAPSEPDPATPIPASPAPVPPPATPAPLTAPDVAVAAPAAVQPVPPPAASGETRSQKMISLSFQDAPLDQILQFYGELTGRTMIKSPGATATITLRGQTKLTEDEVKQAIESVLALNNITLVPLDEKFYRVVQPPTAIQEGLPIRFTQRGQPKESDAMVSQVVELKHMETAEAATILQSILHGYGKVQPLERTNSLMITDTESNINRVMELLAYVDRPLGARVETRVYELKEAVAADVAARLNELIVNPAAQPRRTTTTIIQQAQPTPAGVVRPPTQPTAVRTETGAAERGAVIGDVKVVSDERTNVLIVISDPQNFPFFDAMVEVLDRAVEPETLVKVYTLEYALAEEVAELLNSLIGATTTSRRTGTSGSRTTGGATTRPTTTSTRGATTADDGRSQSIRDFIASQTGRATPAAGADPDGEGIGELSSLTRILPDLRSNSIILMGRKTDLIVLEEVVKEIDVMLAQVVIEAVIIEISLSDEISYGIDWLQRSMQAYNETQAGPGGGITIREPIASWGGGFLGGISSAFRSGAEVGRDVPLSSGSLSYYMTIENLNLDVIIRMAAKDSGARILSTPIILTTDNTEAKIIAGEERPIVTATTITTGGNQTSAYEYKNIGVELTVKPHINPQRVVSMEVKQTADNVGDIVLIDGNEVPVVTKRELSASVAVEDRSTIVLGGLVSNADRTIRSKVPFLGDIPGLGRLFRSDSRSNQRTELLVLLTPYVVRTPHEARAETRRIHDATEAGTSRWFEKGFADSDLARQKRIDLPAPKDQKLPPRIEEFLDASREPTPARSGARTIVVPQTPFSSMPARAPAPAPVSNPRR